MARRRRSRSPKHQVGSPASNSPVQASASPQLSELAVYKDRRDFQLLLQHMEVYGVTFKSFIPSDGNCQFHSISDQLFGDISHHADIRAEIVEWIRENANLVLGNGSRICQFIPDISIADYCSQIATAGTWGDHVTLTAAAELYKASIMVISSAGEDITEIEPLTHQAGRVLLLGHLSESHYFSLRILDEKTTTPGDSHTEFQASGPADTREALEETSSESSMELDGGSDMMDVCDGHIEDAQGDDSSLISTPQSPIMNDVGQDNEDIAEVPVLLNPSETKGPISELELRHESPTRAGSVNAVSPVDAVSPSAGATSAPNELFPGPVQTTANTTHGYKTSTPLEQLTESQHASHAENRLDGSVEQGYLLSARSEDLHLDTSDLLGIVIASKDLSAEQVSIQFNFAFGAERKHDRSAAIAALANGNLLMSYQRLYKTYCTYLLCGETVPRMLSKEACQKMQAQLVPGAEEKDGFMRFLRFHQPDLVAALGARLKNWVPSRIRLARIYTVADVTNTQVGLGALLLMCKFPEELRKQILCESRSRWVSMDEVMDRNPTKTARRKGSAKARRNNLGPSLEQHDIDLRAPQQDDMSRIRQVEAQISRLALPDSEGEITSGEEEDEQHSSSDDMTEPAEKKQKTTPTKEPRRSSSRLKASEQLRTSETPQEIEGVQLDSVEDDGSYECGGDLTNRRRNKNKTYVELPHNIHVDRSLEWNVRPLEGMEEVKINGCILPTDISRWKVAKDIIPSKYMLGKSFSAIPGLDVLFEDDNVACYDPSGSFKAVYLQPTPEIKEEFSEMMDFISQMWHERKIGYTNYAKAASGPIDVKLLRHEQQVAGGELPGNGQLLVNAAGTGVLIMNDSKAQNRTFNKAYRTTYRFQVHCGWTTADTPGKGQKMTYNNIILKTYPERRRMMHEAARSAWTIMENVLQGIPGGPELLAYVKDVMMVAKDTLLVPWDEQMSMWGKIECFFSASNIGVNNPVGIHVDGNNLPGSPGMNIYGLEANAEGMLPMGHDYAIVESFAVFKIKDGSIMIHIAGWENHATTQGYIPPNSLRKMPNYYNHADSRMVKTVVIPVGWRYLVRFGDGAVRKMALDHMALEGLSQPSLAPALKVQRTFTVKEMPEWDFAAGKPNGSPRNAKQARVSTSTDTSKPAEKDCSSAQGKEKGEDGAFPNFVAVVEDVMSFRENVDAGMEVTKAQSMIKRKVHAKALHPLCCKDGRTKFYVDEMRRLMEENEDFPLENLVLASIIFRISSRPAHFQAYREVGNVTIPHTLEQWSAYLGWTIQRREEGKAVAAAEHRTPELGCWGKIVHAAASRLPRLKELLVGQPNREALCAFAEEIMRIKFLKDFFGYKITLDMVHLGLFGDVEAAEDAYVVLGPGARKGMELLNVAGDSEGEFLRKLQQYVNTKARLPHMTLATLEQSLCEYQKFHDK